MEKEILEKLANVCSYSGYAVEGDYGEQTRKRVDVLCEYFLTEELKKEKAKKIKDYNLIKKIEYALSELED